MPALEIHMADDRMNIEEHELPVIEAVLAGTLALMTGYSQALQAELHPQQRLRMGEKIGNSLALLVEQPQLSCGFREVLRSLQARWLAMTACTRDAALDCGACQEPRRSPLAEGGFNAQPAAKRLH